MSAIAANSVTNGTTGTRYRLAGTVPAMKSRNGTGKRSQHAGASRSDPHAEQSCRDDGGRTEKRRQQPAGDEDARRIEEELALERAEGTDRTRRDRRQRGQPFPREERVEVERRIEEVVGVEVAFRKRERARHDRDFIRVVDRRQPVPQTDQSQYQSDQEDTQPRKNAD